jgi:phage tail protein X
MTPNPMNDFENMASRAKKDHQAGAPDDVMRELFARLEDVADRLRDANPGLSDEGLTLKAFDQLFAEARADRQAGSLPIFLLPQGQGQPTTASGARARRKVIRHHSKYPGLSIQQHLAVYLLVTNRTITETAAAVGAQRREVSEWVNWSEPFKAAMEQRRVEIWSVFVEQFRRLRQLEVGRRGESDSKHD